MGNFLCLLFGILLTLGSLGLLVRRGLRPMAAASAYRNAAWRLGLDADTRGLSVQGFLDGRSLYIGQVLDPSSRSPTGTVRAVLELSAPMGLGLRVQRQKRAWGRARPDGEEEPDLIVRAIDDERGRALMTEPVRDALGQLATQGELDVSDHWIRLELPRSFTSDHALLSLVEALRRAALALEESRMELPCPVELDDTVIAWAQLAHRLGLEFFPHLPALEGEVDDFHVRIHSSRGPAGFRADMRIGFPAHRTLGLRIEPQAKPDGFWSVGQDIQFGDDPFDRAFVIKGYDPTTIRSAVGERARQALMAVDAGRIVVTDPYIEVLDLPVDPETLERAIGKTIAIARAIEWP